MKIVLLLVGLFSAFDLVLAQTYVPFPDSNAYWNEIELYQGQCDPPTYCKVTYFLQGDTILDSHYYHKLYSNNGSTVSYVGGMREDHKRVYLYYVDCNRSIVLYDFNLNVGDLTTRTCLAGFCDTLEDMPMKVMSKDSILLDDGSYRNRITFGYGPNWQLRSPCIEGIGCEYGLLYPYYSCVYCVCFLELVCFRQNDIFLYSNEEHVPCFDFMVSTDDKKNNLDHFRFYPNPANTQSFINIESEIENVVGLECYNFIGQRIQFVNGINSKKFQLKTDSFKKGIYFVKISMSNGQDYFEKLIIE
jgi:hypothetical protein